MIVAVADSLEYRLIFYNIILIPSNVNYVYIITCIGFYILYRDYGGILEV